jgi:hypothetical protein
MEQVLVVVIQKHLFIQQADFNKFFKNMRTRILILLMAISFTVNAQGDLQFNQVLTFTGTTGSTIIYTVPVGKVAKITKAKGNMNGSSDSYDIRFTYNGVKLQHAFNQNGGNRHPIDGTWMKANDYIGVLNWSNISDVGYLISIIEYNIVNE